MDTSSKAVRRVADVVVDLELTQTWRKALRDAASDGAHFADMLYREEKSEQGERIADLLRKGDALLSIMGDDARAFALALLVVREALATHLGEE